MFQTKLAAADRPIPKTSSRHGLPDLTRHPLSCPGYQPPAWGHQAGGPGGWSVEAPPETLPPAGSVISFDMAGGDPARPQFAPDHLAANTRRAYSRACLRFLNWCDERGLTLTQIRPLRGIFQRQYQQPEHTDCRAGANRRSWRAVIMAIAVLRATRAGSCSVMSASPYRADSRSAAMRGSILPQGRAPYRPATRSRSPGAGRS
jgi:hypothetical protein